MNILICGDVECRSGRESVEKYLPVLRKELSLDFIVLDVDNAANGFGITPEMANHFFEIGADVLTGGNHLFDQREILPYLDREKRLLRPLNMSSQVPGKGMIETTARNGKKALVVHLLGQKDMPMIGNDPFDCMNQILSKYKLGQNIDAIIVDFHAEVTSEKNAFGNFLDGRVSAVVGTHTHIPTADERILTNGTAFQTDLGMCGDYDSVIGMKKDTAVTRYEKCFQKVKLTSATGEATFCGLFVKTDDKTGLAIEVKFIKRGGRLSPLN